MKIPCAVRNHVGERGSATGSPREAVDHRLGPIRADCCRSRNLKYRATALFVWAYARSAASICSSLKISSWVADYSVYWILAILPVFPAPPPLDPSLLPHSSSNSAALHLPPRPT